MTFIPPTGSKESISQGFILPHRSAIHQIGIYIPNANSVVEKIRLSIYRDLGGVPEFQGEVAEYFSEIIPVSGWNNVVFESPTKQLNPYQMYHLVARPGLSAASDFTVFVKRYDGDQYSSGRMSSDTSTLFSNAAFITTYTNYDMFFKIYAEKVD